LIVTKEIRELRGYENRGGDFHLFFIFEDGTSTEVDPEKVTANLNEYYSKKQPPKTERLRGVE
jgi:hypothetical protein